MNKITIVGLGAGDFEQLPIGIYRLLTNTKHLYMRTKEHPVLEQLEQEGISYTSFDSIYEKHDQFEDVYVEITDILLQAAEIESIVYAVPGHPMTAERTIQLLLQKSPEREVEVEIKGGQSFLDPMFAALKIDPIEGFQMVDATDFNPHYLQLRQHIILCQVYDAFIASEVKLSLMEVLPDDYEVWLVTAAGSTDESLTKLPLFELDRTAELNNLTSVYVPPIEDDSLLYRDFIKLKEIIATLRSPEGCPWDREQTHESLKKHLIEEAYEVLEAIDEQDDEHLVEELGDVLLQIMLHAQIGEDEGYFTVEDVIHAVNSKMIRRHPHVFADTNAESAKEVETNWDQIKKEEKGLTDDFEISILDGIPKGLPGLYRAHKLQKKAAKVGFDWDDAGPMWRKIEEEISELKIELENGDTRKATDELGDILFAVVNIARYYKIDPEDAIQRTNVKFSKRFRYIEDQVRKSGNRFEQMTLDELDVYWNEAKTKE